MASEYPTGTLTLVFTDIEGSSQLSERHRGGFEAVRVEHFRLLRETLQQWGGFEVNTAGDSIFVVFAKASDAIQWAVAAQLALIGYQWPPAIGAIRVRIGMHTGEPFFSQSEGRPNYY